MIKKPTITPTSLLLMVSFSLCSCYTVQPHTGVNYNYSFKLLGEHAKPGNIFDDGKINISFEIDSRDVNFTFENLTDNSMKINWNGASLLINGQNKKVIHKGIKFIYRSNPQAPTEIPGNSSIEDKVFPKDNLHFTEDFPPSFSSWKKEDLLLSWDGKKEEKKKLILNSKGQTIKFILPVEQNGQTISYTFEFEITDVIPVTNPQR